MLLCRHKIYPSSKNSLRGDRMELDTQVAYNLFKTSSIFSLVYAGRDNILAQGNPSQEKDTWKGKAEAMELR